MKPLAMIAHNNELALHFHHKLDKSRIFYAWKQIHFDKLMSYQAKSKSVEDVWAKMT